MKRELERRLLLKSQVRDYTHSTFHPSEQPACREEKREKKSEDWRDYAQRTTHFLKLIVGGEICLAGISIKSFEMEIPHCWARLSKEDMEVS